MSKKLAIFGGAGFVGVNLAIEAMRRNDRIVVYDLADRFCRFGQAIQSVHPAVEFVECDLAAGAPFVSDDVDIAINLAALPHVEFSIYEPQLSVKNNIDIQLNILQALHGRDIPIVFASSIEIYGGNDGAPFDERHAFDPLSPYAASKIACEQILHSHAHAFGLRAATARLTNLYGPWQTPDRLAPRLMARLINGLDCEVDAQRMRDFVHVRDAARALLAIADGQFWGETFNVSTGASVTTRQIAHIIAEHCGGAGKILIAGDRDFDGRGFSLIGDGRKLSSKTKWRAEIDLYSGFMETCGWYREHADWLLQFEPVFHADRTGPQYIADYLTWPGVSQSTGRS